MYKIKDLYDLNETIAAKLFDGVEYPWEVLANIGDFIIELGKTLPKDKFDHPQEDIWIAKDVTIAKTATLNGPLIIDEGTEVRPGAFIRGKVIVGKDCVVGNSTELKNVVLFNTVQVPHYNDDLHIFHCICLEAIIFCLNIQIFKCKIRQNISCG